MNTRSARLSRNVILLGIVSMLSDMSSEIYFAILPYFILELGGSSVAIGIVAGVTDGFVSFLKAFSGYLADRLRAGKKRFVYWGYGLPAIFKIVMAFAKSWPVFLVLRLFERAGKGIRTAPRDAIIAESSHRDNVGRSFGFHRALDSFGAVIGSLLSLFLVSVLLLSNQTIIVISGIVGFLALTPIFMVDDPKIKTEYHERRGIREFLDHGVQPGYWKINLVTALHGLSLLSYMFLILLSSDLQLFGLTGISLGVSLYVLYNIVYTLTSYGAGALSDRIGRIKTIKLGFTIYTVAISLLYFSNIWVLILSFVIFGIAYGFNEGNIRALPAAYISKEFKPTGYGIFHGIFGFSILFGNLIAGYLFQLGLVYMVTYVMVVSVLALTSLFSVRSDISI